LEALAVLGGGAHPNGLIQANTISYHLGNQLGVMAGNIGECSIILTTNRLGGSKRYGCVHHEQLIKVILCTYMAENSSQNRKSSERWTQHLTKSQYTKPTTKWDLFIYFGLSTFYSRFGKSFVLKPWPSLLYPAKEKA